VLVSLPALSCPCCWLCASVIAKLAFKGLAYAALAFAGVALASHMHCGGVIAIIALSLLLLALRRCC
jgi:hypothetical protein